MNKLGPIHYFHLHARAPPKAVPGCVDERMLGRPSPDPMTYALSLLFIAQLYACFGHESIYISVYRPLLCKDAENR